MTVRPNQLRNRARRIDRLNMGVASVLEAMRSGVALHLEISNGRMWCLSDGRGVSDRVAHLIIRNEHVVGVGDALFADAVSQTYRYVE